MRRLIINADDFGLTGGINRSIEKAHEQGVLTSATLMSGAPKFCEATRVAQAHPNLGVGCHVVLIDGVPLTDPALLPTLVPHSSSCFRTSVSQLAALAVAGRIAADEIEAEATVQFRRIQSEGLTISHFDTHKHAHVFPTLLEPLLRAARTCGIPALRNPFEPFHALPIALLRTRPRLWKRYLQTRALRSFQPKFRKLVRRSGLKTTDGTLGIIVTGVLDAAIFASVINDMPEGTWELVCHPGHNDEELQSAATRLRESRAVEHALLTAPETCKRLANRGIELISYRDL